MVLRGVGEVGCAHCKQVGADRACQVCTRLVCPTCAADWATCDQPSGRTVRLGLTARVRDVDPRGRLALVSHWRRPLRIFDLRALRWVPEVDLPRMLYLWARAYPPRLTSTGEIVHVELGLRESRTAVIGIRWRPLGPADSGVVAHPEAPAHGTAVSALGDRFSYVTDSQRVVVMQRSGERVDVHDYEPLPRRTVQAAAIDGEGDLLVASTWSELAAYRLEGSKLPRIGHEKTAVEGDIFWLGVGGGRVASATYPTTWSYEAPRTTIAVRSLGDTLGETMFTTKVKLRPTAIALSRDGRHLAIATRENVLEVHDIETGTVMRFDEHTDEINYVRFASDDHVLISADTDNRVVLRPRTLSGYAKPLLAVDVPDA